MRRQCRLLIPVHGKRQLEPRSSIRLRLPILAWLLHRVLHQEFSSGIQQLLGLLWVFVAIACIQANGSPLS